MMGKKIRKYRYNLLCSAGILAVLWVCVTLYSGVIEGYFDIFAFAMLLAPMMLIIIAKNNVKSDLIFALVIVCIIALYAIAFWWYKDGFLFSTIPEDERGYFSFENRLRLDILFMGSAISVLISLFIRLVYSKFKAGKERKAGAG